MVRNGSASGLRRYKCRACQRTFNALSTAPQASLGMTAKWLKQQEVLLQGLRERKAAQGVSFYVVLLAPSILAPGTARLGCRAHWCNRSQRDLLPALQQGPATGVVGSLARRSGVASASRRGLDPRPGGPIPIGRHG
ncbi:transposase-like zinc-binding domain-containing protein [Roseateles sp. SL47]|uniref:IS1/IS1595 family N-terminal zinc-binding domain-containing protein n=1 Tax=Roseateles sp. SL47 TaxID=2995138 RepID=UPI003B63D1AD